MSILMPVFNESGYLEACLRGLLSQTYPGDRVEVLVADGGSTDGTKEMLRSIAAGNPRVRVIENPERHQAAGLNRALRAARGQVIVRTDCHAEYATDYVERCVDTLELRRADVVGGPQRVRSRGFFQSALAAALRSPLGMGGAAFRREDRSGFVDTVFLGAFRRRVFETVGLYDPEAVPNEDAELNQRIVLKGGSLYLEPAITVYYYPRDSLRGLAWQYFRYGRARARTLLKHRRLLTARPLVPFIALWTAVLSATLGSPALLLALLAPYVVAVLLEAVRVAAALGAGSVLTAMVIFPTLHLSHATGFTWGVIRYLARPDWTPAPLLPPLESGFGQGPASISADGRQAGHDRKDSP